MARETKTAGATDTDVVATKPLIDKLATATTSADLWRIGGTDEFKAEFATLTETQQRQVRDYFKANEIGLRGKIKAEDVGARWNADKAMHEGGEILRVMSWDYPPNSPKFPDSEFIVLKGVREEHNGDKFELVSGAMRIVRHFKNINPKDVPQRIVLIQESDDDVAQRGGLRPGTQRMWQVKRLPQQRTDGAAVGTGMPF